jgi:threonylcarbamoyladenosine tRNA methylthiotransferase MtaB
MKMRRVSFYTLGCKVNQYETEAMREKFDSRSYRFVPFGQEADIYIINTCTVTSRSDRKSRWAIRRACLAARRAAKKRGLVVVTGCYAQAKPEEISAIPGVNLVLGNSQKPKISEYSEYIEKYNGSGAPLVSVGELPGEYEDLNISRFWGRTRAFVKIQDGCDQFCSYCKVPYVRGSLLRNRKTEEVLKEAIRLRDNGFKEIVLTGIRLGTYRDGLALADLIKSINDIEGIERIRLSSLEPQDISEDLIEAMGRYPKVCPHLHIPLQSGDDEILKLMKRRSTSSDYERLIARIREALPEVAITTDVIVGFPGETEESFQRSYNFISRMNFARMHIFKYSRREGTEAARLKGEVGKRVAKERSRRMLGLALQKAEEFRSRYRGKLRKVLIESRDPKTKLLGGFTDNYIRVMVEGGDSLCNKIIEAKI